MRYLLIILSLLSFLFSFNNRTNIRPYYDPIDEFVGSPKYYIYKNINNESDIIFRKMESIPLQNYDTLFIRTTYGIDKVKIVEWRNIINKNYVQSVDTDFKYSTPSKQPWLLSINDKYIEKKVAKENRNVADTVNYDRTFLGIVDNYYKNNLYKTALYYETVEYIYTDTTYHSVWISYSIKDVGVVKWINLNNHNGFVLDKVIDQDEFYNW